MIVLTHYENLLLSLRWQVTGGTLVVQKSHLEMRFSPYANTTHRYL